MGGDESTRSEHDRACSRLTQDTRSSALGTLPHKVRIGELETYRSLQRLQHFTVASRRASTARSVADDLALKHAAIFTKIMPLMKSYTNYCGTYVAAIELLKSLRSKSSKFAKFIAGAEAHPSCRGLDLSSFLIKPPQRLCKYPLFFNDLLKSLGDASAPSTAVKQVLEQIQQITRAVNAGMADSGSMGRVYEIFKDNLDAHESVSDLVSPSRRFLFEGEVDCASSTKAPKRHHFYLFKDLLLLTTPRRNALTGAELAGKFKVKHRFALVDISIEEAPAAISLNANDHLFLARFDDQNGGSMSVHWTATDGSSQQSRPKRADFLLWSDEAAGCEKLKNALQRETYEIKVEHANLVKRRAHVGQQHAVQKKVEQHAQGHAPVSAEKRAASATLPKSCFLCVGSDAEFFFLGGGTMTRIK